MVHLRDTVKWANGREPLGVVVHTFHYKGLAFAVVERPNGTLQVARICDNLEVINSIPRKVVGE